MPTHSSHLGPAGLQRTAGLLRAEHPNVLRLDHALDPAAHRWWAGTFSIYLPMIGLTAAVTLLNVVLGSSGSARRLPAFSARPAATGGRRWALRYCCRGRAAHAPGVDTHAFRGTMSTRVPFVKIELVAVTGSTIVQTIVFIAVERRDERHSAARLFLTVDDMRSYGAARHSR